ncbi:UNVERIFIED_ORG: putative metalloprotease with PDZ domain [Sphingomonas sp. R1F5B]
MPQFQTVLSIRALLPLAAALTMGTAPRQPDQLAVTLRPDMADGAVAGVAVAMDLPAPADGTLLLAAPVVYPGAPGVADRLSGLAVTDARGPVPLAVSEDAPVKGGFPWYRHWRATRTVQGQVAIRYRAAVMPAGGPGGPAFGLRAVGGGLAASGGGFLLLPENRDALPARLHWDLSAMARGASAAISYGAGDVVVPGGAQALADSWFMAGPLGHWPATGTRDGFAGTWLGQPVFDVPTALARAGAAHRYLQGYFPHLKGQRAYRIFVQFRDAAPYGGGTALDQSFMLSRGPLAPGEQSEMPSSLFFHEMIHQWTGQIDAPSGISSWFSEGLTTYYEDDLQWRGGFESADAYLAAVNRLARRYFTSKARNMAAADVVKIGFGDEEVRHIVYYRAAMYFHDLDARIRAHSQGQRTLESVLFPLFLSREQGARFDTEAWLAAIVRELGDESERDRFKRLILDGTDTLDPLSDTFGPCFARVAAQWDTPHGRVDGWQWQRAAPAGQRAAPPAGVCR